MPGLVLIDGGLGQLHAAADALEAIGIINQPLASIAKREEIIYVFGQEDEPIVLDRFSPILHLVQTIRDEAHRFAVTFHRTRRNARAPDVGAGPDRRRRREDRAEAAEAFRKFGVGADGQRRSAHGSGGTSGGAAGEAPLRGAIYRSAASGSVNGGPV